VSLIVKFPVVIDKSEVDALRREKNELLERLAAFSRKYESLEKELRVAKQQLANTRRRIY